AAGAPRVIAFEPFAPARAIMTCNLDLNGCAGRVALESLALGAAPGTLNLYVPLDTHNLLETSASLNSQFRSAHSQVVPVTVITLDEYVAQRVAPGETISVVKIDVEGEEHAVLAGAAETVARHRPILIVEVLDRAAFSRFDQFCQAGNYLDVIVMPNRAVVDSATRFYPEMYNHWFVPAERLDRFQAVLRGLGIAC